MIKQVLRKKGLQTLLQQQNIVLDLHTVRPFFSHGLMSELATVESNKGALLVHNTHTVAEQRHQRIEKKTLLISQLLLRRTNLPVARVLFATRFQSGNVLTLQTILPGSPLGKRVLKKNQVQDLYFQNSPKLTSQLCTYLANLHHVKVPGYGFLITKNGKVQGRYATWEAFLRRGARRWLRNLHIRSTQQEQIQQYLNIFFQKYHAVLQWKHGRLLHGDMINPSNVLVEHGKISGIVDFEWALSGDPAWEFAFSDTGNLRSYFRQACLRGDRYDATVFRKKIQVYRVLWLLWGANVHAQGGKLYDILYQQFLRELKKSL